MKKLLLLIGLVVFISTHAKAQNENIVDKIVYNALKGKMGNELHALAIKTKEKG